MTRIGLIAAMAVLSLGTFLVLGVAAEDKLDEAALRAKAAKLQKDGNYKEAWEAYSQLALAADTDPKQVGNDLRNAITSLSQINRVNEVDDFREKVIALHKDNWRLLRDAAESYMGGPYHYGYMVAGEYERGHHRGGGKMVNSYERDRVRALQLMQQAMGKIKVHDGNRAEVGDFYWKLAQWLMGNRGFNEAWRLQYLSDLGELPDFEEGYYGRYGYYSPSAGAPVDADGNPVFHHLPKSWEAAETDGERWRWAMLEAMESNPARTGQVRMHFADFLENQFGVQTMQQYSWYFARSSSGDDKAQTFALHTLGEDETIARLATGVKRFKLPDEFNHVKILQELADDKKLGQGEAALNKLAPIFENRRQYPKAAQYWRRNIQEHGPGHNNWKQARLKQIVDNWCTFEPVVTQPAGQGATVDFRFRNGKKVTFTAHAVKVDKLLEDVKAYLKGNPPELKWEQVNIGRIGYRLVAENQQQYVGEQVASWDLDLEPREKHFDRRITVATPLQKAGAYLLTGKMADGNTTRIIIWVADTAIVHKPLADKVYYFVADAVTGQPVAKANVEFFGYWQEYHGWDKKPRYTIHTRNFAEFTDADGQVLRKPDADENRYQWLVTARTDEGRFAYMGWTSAWYGGSHDAEYNATKTFVITDRPVYRPSQKVHFKFWVNYAKYDQEGKSAFAGRQFTVRIDDPKGEKVHEVTLKADDYGGFDGEFELGEEATLGVYRIYIPHAPHGGSSFRVEEYKKPEFEVTVDSPSEPVMLGEKVAAKVKAKYYFGAPVVNAKVKYKILRYDHDATWYPIAYWDWFYGRGYWWFAYDYTWYPGWYEWGCKRPSPGWWWGRWRPQPQPEVVAEAEVPIGPDGTVDVNIDTTLAKEVFGDRDHRYEITAEVTDQSRRTIVGTGQVLVARQPFKVYAWVDHGYFRAGDVIQAHFNAQTIDNKPVQGKGKLTLYDVSYKKEDGKIVPVEKAVQVWDLPTNVEGLADVQIKAGATGQFRLSYEVTDAKGHAIEGGYVFVVRGRDFDGGDFRFNEIELVPDKKEYKPGEKVELMVNTNRAGGTVVLFTRPANGIYLEPKVIRLEGKSVVEAVEVLKKDMPNFFVEAFTVSNGEVYSEAREIVVPPEQRVLDVAVTPNKKEYKPGEKATVKIKLVDPTGEPFVGSTVVSLYDKAVEYISGGSNVPEIKEFFWKWRRHHRINRQTNLDVGSSNLLKRNEIGMGFLGVFGYSVADDMQELDQLQKQAQQAGQGGRRLGGVETEYASRKAASAEPGAPMATAAPGNALRDGAMADRADKAEEKSNAEGGGGGGPSAQMVEPTVRSKFADTALWVAALTTNEKGEAEVELTMPENLTAWKARVWAMGDGTRVGEGTTEVVTTKDLIVRLQAPRFFVQKDEVVLSANVHNYLDKKKSVKVILECEGGTLVPMQGPQPAPGEKWLSQQTVEIDANGEKRVDWRVKVVEEGEALVRMKGLTDEESDAMEMKFPVFVHGMLKTESWSGVIRPKQDTGEVTIKVPAERRPEQSRLEIRYSPTLAGAMVDALPYMAEYPYGCTEQTLNRFLPTVITQKVLLDMGLDLAAVKEKRTNLNAQEIGDDVKRAQDWQRLIGKNRWDGEKWVPRNPVFDQDEVKQMVKAGLERLGAMQNGDGGWGWFSGWGEHSYPHTTAWVVRGLLIARDNDVAVVPGMLDRGVAWLKQYQAEQLRRLKLPKGKPWHKDHADNLDALVYSVLVDAKDREGAMAEMQDFLYRDRNELAVYTKSMFGLALHKVGQVDRRDMLRRNVEQFLVQDDENQTAWLNLQGGWWWYWYGSEYEAHACYLKLLAAVEPKSEVASRMVKYLINNRRHATYWTSTRDTALVIEAFADYIRASGEDKPDMTVQIVIDGKQVKEVKINAENLFSYDNKLVLTGKDVTTGEHKVVITRKGAGPVYFNAYLTNFTLEDPITKAGLEIKVERNYFKLVRDKEATEKRAGSRGQALDVKVEKYKREPLKNLDMLTSGDLVEIELVIESKNDYEYIMFEDMKASGFEPVALQSGYGDNEMGAYMELRDERVAFFVRALARGKHSITYRMRAEIPGKFSALPTKASAMYAPELKANSDEIKLQIQDQPQ